MSFEEITDQMEVVEESTSSKENTMIIDDKNLQYEGDVWHEWTDKSSNIPFKSTTNCVGNGEEKLRKELNISTPLGGQNNTIDMIHSALGDISVKADLDCRLGTDASNDMRKIFRTTINLFVCWILKYRSNCELANKFYKDINRTYGKSKRTLIESIDRLELSKPKLQKINKLLNDIKKYYSEGQYSSLNSEYINDIICELGDKSFQDIMNEVVRNEAIEKTLVIVDKEKGWLIVRDISKLSCPRITQGAPRINYS